MASRIQGIIVEIGGDTTKLTDALKDVNSEIRTTQSQLRNVEKLLKLYPPTQSCCIKNKDLYWKELKISTKNSQEVLLC